jgi:hypothetical protein
MAKRGRSERGGLDLAALWKMLKLGAGNLGWAWWLGAFALAMLIMWAVIRNEGTKRKIAEDALATTVRKAAVEEKRLEAELARVSAQLASNLAAYDKPAIKERHECQGVETETTEPDGTKVVRCEGEAYDWFERNPVLPDQIAPVEAGPDAGPGPTPPGAPCSALDLYRWRVGITGGYSGGWVWAIPAGHDFGPVLGIRPWALVQAGPGVYLGSVWVRF